jgi:hypothetical protein
LAYVLTITHLDVKGRVTGDPLALRALIFPRRDDIPAETIESYVQEWAAAGFVTWYTADGDLWMEFPKFKENQPNLRQEREETSTIPDPETGEIMPAESCQSDLPAPAESLRSDSGATPERLRTTSPHKRSKEKRSKENLRYGAETGAACSQNGLYAKVKTAFESKYGDFDNYAKEGKAIHGLIEKARIRGDPEVVLPAMIRTFWRLKNGREEFFQKQPFLPSALNASGIWPRVMEYAKEHSDEALDPEVSKEIERLFS